MVLAALLEDGAHVLVPFGASLRYDLVVERDGEFQRVQCKTGRLRKGVIVAQASSVSAPHRGGKRKDYKGDADLFGIYCPETKAVYMVPVEGSPKREIRLRLKPTKNNQSSSVRWAKDYQLRP